MVSPLLYFTLLVLLLPLLHPFLFFGVISRRRHHQHHHQARHNKRYGNQSHQRHTPPTSRELATNNPMLALKVPVETDKENHDADPQEGCAERFPQVAQPGCGIGVVGCGAEEVVEEGGGLVFRGAVDGVLLLLEGCLDMLVDIWG
jgi:hypothetical protein